MARPKKVVDPTEVENWASIGCTAEEIGSYLNVGTRTIERRFGASVKKGRHKLHGILKRELIKQAKAGNTGALIFALKVHCGMKEPRDDAVSINVSATATGNVLSFTPEDRKRLEDLATDIRARVFKRSTPTTHELAPSGNGDVTQN